MSQATGLMKGLEISVTLHHGRDARPDEACRQLDPGRGYCLVRALRDDHRGRVPEDTPEREKGTDAQQSEIPERRERHGRYQVEASFFAKTTRNEADGERDDKDIVLSEESSELGTARRVAWTRTGTL